MTPWMNLSLFVAIVYLFGLANAGSRQKKQDVDGFEYNCIHDKIAPQIMEKPHPDPSRRKRADDVYEPMRIHVHPDSSITNSEDYSYLLSDENSVFWRAVETMSKGLTVAPGEANLTIFPSCYVFTSGENDGLCVKGTISHECGIFEYPEYLSTPITVCASENGSCGMSAGGPGVMADYILIVGAADDENCGETTLAFASICELDNYVLRPAAGYINICTQNVQQTITDDSLLHNIILHELSHAFGFSHSVYPYYYGFDSESPIVEAQYENRTVYGVKTPMLAEHVQEYFGCSGVDYAPTENTFENGASSHWEARMFNHELMTAIVSYDYQVTSNTTWHYFHDSDWYEVNYTYTNALDQFTSEWGKDKGCDVFTFNCSKYEYSCQDDVHQCTFDRIAKGTCFNGGSFDECSVVESDVRGSCLFSFNYQNSSENTFELTQSYGRMSRCFDVRNTDDCSHQPACYEIKMFHHPPTDEYAYQVICQEGYCDGPQWCLEGKHVEIGSDYMLCPSAQDLLLRLEADDIHIADSFVPNPLCDASCITCSIAHDETKCNTCYNGELIGEAPNACNSTEGYEEVECVNVPITGCFPEFSTCCPGGDCQIEEADCYCDINCYGFGDCCFDIHETCPKPTPSSTTSSTVVQPSTESTSVSTQSTVPTSVLPSISSMISTASSVDSTVVEPSTSVSQSVTQSTVLTSVSLSISSMISTASSVDSTVVEPSTGSTSVSVSVTQSTVLTSVSPSISSAASSVDSTVVEPSTESTTVSQSVTQSTVLTSVSPSISSMISTTSSVDSTVVEPSTSVSQSVTQSTVLTSVSPSSAASSVDSTVVEPSTESTTVSQSVTQSTVLTSVSPSISSMISTASSVDSTVVEPSTSVSQSVTQSTVLTSVLPSISSTASSVDSTGVEPSTESTSVSQSVTQSTVLTSVSPSISSMISTASSVDSTVVEPSTSVSQSVTHSTVLTSVSPSISSAASSVDSTVVQPSTESTSVTESTVSVSVTPSPTPISCADNDVRIDSNDVVELCMNNIWGGVCYDSDWDYKEAVVLCKQMDMLFSGAYTGWAASSDYSSSHIKGVACTGTEDSFGVCPYVLTNGEACRSGQVAKAFCAEAIKDCNDCNLPLECTVNGISKGNDNSQVSGSTLSCSIEFNITSVDLSDSNVDSFDEILYLTGHSTSLMKQIGLINSEQVRDRQQQCHIDEQFPQHGDPIVTLQEIGIETLRILYQDVDGFPSVKDFTHDELRSILVKNDFSMLFPDKSFECSFQHLLYWLTKVPTLSPSYCRQEADSNTAIDAKVHCNSPFNSCAEAALIKDFEAGEHPVISDDDRVELKDCENDY